MKVSITLNGKEHHGDVEPRTLLVHYIREVIGLTGTNVGCDTSSCGACTIHLDGEAAKSCTILAVQADGASVTTIEGLAAAQGAAEKLAPIQAAWIEHQVPQCGYCQSGQIMQAASFLDLNAAPTDAQIDAAMSGNLCRCCTYPRIRAAIHGAAAKLQAS